MQITDPLLMPFTIPLAVVVIMVTLQLLLMLVAGVGLDFDGEADADFDADLDADLDADVDVDADIEVDSEPSIFAKILNPLGVGRVPLSVVWNAYFLGFGISGLATTWGLAQFVPVSPLLLAATIPVSAVAGWLITVRAVRLVLPLFKICGRPESDYDLIGRSATVTSNQFNSSFGEISVLQNGVINHLIAQPVDESEQINKGDTVVVTDFDRETKRPIVTKVKE